MELDEKSILQQVRTAAELLIDDLQHGQSLTRDWADHELADAWLEVKLPECLQRLTATGCWGEANRVPSSEFWRIAEPWLERGALQHRARFKPRGYAGDFEMLDWICTHRCCEDPLGSAFDRYFLRQAAPEAVRGRTAQAAAAIAVECLQSKTDACHVVSIGSGPAADLFQAAATLPVSHRSRLRMTLLDLDPDALAFARGRLETLLPAEAIACRRENLFRLFRRKDSTAMLGSPDVLICSGLFDYLDDGVATEILRRFWDCLAPGGLMMVSNFAPHNPTRAYMEWIGCWHLLYRTMEQMHALGLAAGIPIDCFHIASEPIGVDLVLIARR